jgi:hypothetical protein
MIFEVALENISEADLAETVHELSQGGLEVSFKPSHNVALDNRRGLSDYSLAINVVGLGLSAISLIVTVVAGLRARRPQCTITLKVPGENGEMSLNVSPSELEEAMNRLIAASSQTQDPGLQIAASQSNKKFDE